MECWDPLAPDGRWRVPLAPHAGSHASEDVVELDCRRPLVPPATAATHAAAALMQDLVLAPAIDVEPQFEDASAVAECSCLDGSSSGPAHDSALLPRRARRRRDGTPPS